MSALDSENYLGGVVLDVHAKTEDFQADDLVSRASLLKSAQALVASLEHPAERAARIAFYDPTLGMAVRLGLAKDLFSALPEDDSPKDVESLAKQAKIDPRLLERLLKHLATGQIVTETSPDTYAPNAVTKVLATNGGKGTIINAFGPVSLANSGRMIEYLDSRDWMNPTNKDDSAFQHTYDTRQHYFEWLYAPGNEEQAQYFKDHTEFKTLGPKWYQTLPVDEILDHPTDPDAVLYVDVGGANDFDLLGFHQAWPNLKGRLVVQDLAANTDRIDTASLPSNVSAMGYDFFTPQPVRGAKAYYLKMVLHDWPDAQCKQILTNLKGAMIKGHSEILINEIVIPETDAGWFETSVDMLMLFAHSGQERREQTWRLLIESVDGLKVTRIWDCAGAPEKLIQVELV